MSLRTAIPGPAGLLALRRKTVAALGIAAIFAVSGSQAMAPVSVTFRRADPEPLEGQSYYFDPSWAATPADPVSALTAAAAPGSTPYGYASSAAFTASGIPEPAYRAYVAAAAELARTDPSCKISWTLIAGIGRVESNHGRFGGSTILPSGLVSPPILGIKLDGSRPGTARVNDSDNGRYDGDPVTDRAVGPMQFLPATWKIYGGGADPQNMNAASLATGRYLCAGDGSLDTQAGRWAAVYRYNHSDSYASLVLALADSYATGHVTTFPSRPSGTPKSDDKAPAATPPGVPPALPPVSSPPVSTPTAAPTTASPTTVPTTPVTVPTTPVTVPTTPVTVPTTPVTVPTTPVTGPTDSQATPTDDPTPTSSASSADQESTQAEAPTTTPPADPV